MESLDHEDQQRLRSILVVATSVATLKEDRSHYSHRLSTTPRRLVLAAGRRLVEKDVLDDPNDIFYLHTGNPAIAPADRELKLFPR